ncbi:MAG: type II secretion system protein GspK [Desulfobacterota bacterium]|nr:type II secretion system protein GspK [Thermodesulfobacteriota bacterium]
MSQITRQKGVALIMVLWVMAILSVIVFEFSFGMRTELNMAGQFKEELQLYGMAEGGLHRAIVELIYLRDPKIREKRKGLKAEEVAAEKREWITDGRAYTVSFTGGRAEVRIIGEDGKININTVSESLLRKILKNMGLEGDARDVVVDSILDWRDPDDFYRLNGAENDYYRGLAEPYDCKNGPLDSLEELLLVRGVTAQLFHGLKRKDEEGQVEKVGLKDLFSIYASGEQIDLNSAPSLVMRMVLGIPKEVSVGIVKAREERPIENQQDLLRRVPEMAPFIAEAARLIAYRPRTAYYTVESRARAQEGGPSRGLKAIVKIDAREKKGYKVVQWVDVI